MRYAVVIALLFAVAAYAGAGIGDPHPPLYHAEVVSPNPPYTGAYVDIDDFNGDVVLVYFWKC
jgi:hypothetical protein